MSELPFHGPPPDDEEALVRAAQEQPDAFAALYLRYLGPIYRYLLARTGNAPDAEDLAQETFLRAYRALPSFRPSGKPILAWLLRIARNAVIDVERRQRNERATLPRLLPPPSAETSDDTLFLVEDLVRSLPPEKRDLLALRFAAGLSTSEIAALLGKREGAVRKQLYRIVCELREALHAQATD